MLTDVKMPQNADLEKKYFWGQRIYPVGGSSAIKNKLVSLLYGTY